MDKCKRFKDPVYGYISIPEKYIRIIDTAVFQRLRRIIQTSYAPLYSSAVHNRFVHSMGVFHLGEIVIESVIENSGERLFLDAGMDLPRCKEVFKMACLLHDVGHAPFSHTGEVFYLKDQWDYLPIHQLLVEAVGSSSFERDIPNEKREYAAPHEIMSAIVGISNFADCLADVFEKEFFARCITGYKYSEKGSKNSLLNCLISLLNSKVIDVDKLDYLIRDAFIIGFDTVALDYNRLLKSVVIVDAKGRYEVAYKKAALSVIENVIYAHDAERKWIQNHPVVLYECYILQNVFKRLQEEMSKRGINLFSYETLGHEGIKMNDGSIMRLLCDDDIIHFMKNLLKDKWSDQYFERSKRMHPVWKSEPEYKALVINNLVSDVKDDFERAMESLVKYLEKNGNEWVADDKLIETIDQEVKAIADNAEMDALDKSAQLKDKKGVLKILKSLKKYAYEQGIKNEFVLISAKQFNSGFGKPDFTDTYLLFNEDNGKKAKFGEVVNTFEVKESDSKEYFYLYYNKIGAEKTIDSYDICKRICEDFNKS